MNTTLQRALNMLCHPIVLAAAGVMLLNDAWLRWYWPNAWTGKLSDVAWLVLAPACLAPGLALLLPRRPGWVAGLALALSGGFFAAFKALPVVHAVVVGVFQGLSGLSPGVLQDPADLVALPALLLAAWAWQSARPPRQGVSILRWLPVLGVPLLLMADAGMPNYGIACLKAEGNTLYAGGAYTLYDSSDGGRTWGTSQHFVGQECHLGRQEPYVSGGAAERYRLTPGKMVERSTDGGQTWQVIYTASQLSQPLQVYYQRNHPGNPVTEQAPLDLLVDPVSKKVFLAMGHEGLLVYDPTSSQFSQVAVGPYAPVKLTTPALWADLLNGEFFLAGVVWLLGLGFLGRHLYQRTWLRWLVLGVPILGFLISVIAFPPALSIGYMFAPAQMLVFLLVLMSLPIGIETLVRFVRHARAQLRFSIGGSALAGAAFLLPYGLWIIQLLPAYWMATCLAFLLVAVVLFTFDRY